MKRSQFLAAYVAPSQSIGHAFMCNPFRSVVCICLALCAGYALPSTDTFLPSLVVAPPPPIPLKVGCFDESIIVQQYAVEPWVVLHNHTQPNFHRRKDETYSLFSKGPLAEKKARTLGIPPDVNQNLKNDFERKSLTAWSKEYIPGYWRLRAITEELRTKKGLDIVVSKTSVYYPTTFGVDITDELLQLMKEGDFPKSGTEPIHAPEYDLPGWEHMVPDIYH